MGDGRSQAEAQNPSTHGERNRSESDYSGRSEMRGRMDENPFYRYSYINNIINISCRLKCPQAGRALGLQRAKNIRPVLIFSIRIESVNCPYIFTSVPDPMIYIYYLYFYYFMKDMLDTPSALNTIGLLLLNFI